MEDSFARLLGLEEKDCAVSKIEVDEVLRLMGDKRSEVAANDTMPGRSLALVELERIVS